MIHRPRGTIAGVAFLVACAAAAGAGEDARAADATWRIDRIAATSKSALRSGVIPSTGPSGGGLSAWIDGPRLRIATVERLGVAYTLTRQLASETTEGPFGSAAVARGRRAGTVVAWDRRLEGASGSILVRRQLSNGRWSPPRRLAPSQPGGFARGVQLAADAAGDTYAIWVEQEQPSSAPAEPGVRVKVKFSELRFRASQWSTPQDLSSAFGIDPLEQKPASIVASDRGDIVVTWRSGCAAGQCQQVMIRRPAGAAGFSLPERLSGDAEVVQGVEDTLAIASSGQVVAAWNGVSPGAIRTRLVNASDGALGPIQTLAVGDAGARIVATGGSAGNGGTCTLGWHDREIAAPRNQLVVSRKDCDSPSWGPAISLTDSLISHGGQPGSLAASPTGKPAAIWWQQDGPTRWSLRLATASGVAERWSQSRVLKTQGVPVSSGPGADAVTLRATAGALIATWQACDAMRCYISRGTRPLP